MPLPLLAAGAIMGGSALASGIGGYLGADAQLANYKAGKGKLNQVKSNINDQTAQLMGMSSELYDPMTKNAAGDMEAYRNLANQDLSQFGYDPADPFSYNMDAGMKQFLDPTMDAQIASATQAVEGSAANAGKLFSSSTGKGIADRAQDISRQSWKEAMQSALQDRGFQYNVYGDDISRDRQAKDQGLNLYNTQLGSAGNLANMGSNALQGYANSQLGLQQQGFEGMNNADIALANMMMNKGPGRMASAFGGAAQGAAAMAPLMGQAMGGASPTVKKPGEK